MMVAAFNLPATPRKCSELVKQLSSRVFHTQLALCLRAEQHLSSLADEFILGRLGGSCNWSSGQFLLFCACACLSDMSNDMSIQQATYSNVTKEGGPLEAEHSRNFENLFSHQPREQTHRPTAGGTVLTLQMWSSCRVNCNFGATS